MKQSIIGAIAGAGKGATDFAQFMYEDIKQQRLQQFQSGEAAKQREFTAAQNKLSRDQSADQFDRRTQLDEDRFDYSKSVDAWNQEIAEKKLTLEKASQDDLSTYRDAQIKQIDQALAIGELQKADLERLNKVKEDFATATTQDAMDAALSKWRTLVNGPTGKKLIKLQERNEFGAVVGETPWVFDEDANTLTSPGGGLPYGVDAEDAAVLRQAAAAGTLTEEMSQDFISDHGQKAFRTILGASKNAAPEQNAQPASVASTMQEPASPATTGESAPLPGNMPGPDSADPTSIANELAKRETGNSPAPEQEQVATKDDLDASQKQDLKKKVEDPSYAQRLGQQAGEDLRWAINNLGQVLLVPAKITYNAGREGWMLIDGPIAGVGDFVKGVFQGK